MSKVWFVNSSKASSQFDLNLGQVISKLEVKPVQWSRADLSVGIQRCVGLTWHFKKGHDSVCQF